MSAYPIPPIEVPHITPNPDANALAFFEDLGTEGMRLLWENMGVLTTLVLTYLAINYGGALIAWVRSGFGRWDDNGQGKLF